MKEIHINSKKHGIHVILIDDDDYDRVSSFKWSLHVRTYCPHLRYATNDRHGYLHRFVLNIPKGELIKSHIDHRDGNGLNCQKGNLRICSDANNHRNRIVPKNSTTGYKGVCFRHGRYVSRIMINGKRISLGCYGTAHEAARVYNEAAVVHHGDFASLNQLQ